MDLLQPPRHPFIGLTITAAVGILLADFFPTGHAALLLLAATTTGLGLLLLAFARTALTYGFVCLSFFVLHSIRTTDSAGLRLSAMLGQQPRAIACHGTVMSEPKIGAANFATFLMRLTAINLDGRTLATNATVFVRWRGNVGFGDELALFGMAQPVAGPRNPGEFDMRAYLARHDVREAVFVRYAEEGHVLGHHTGNPILRAALRSRDWLKTTICRGLNDAPDVENFLSGVVLGLRHQTPEDIEQPFQQTGTLHLFAVAGLHVGIVARLLWLIAMVAQLPRRWAAAIVVPLLFFYAAVTGLHVSSVRAAIMSSAFLGGFLFEREALPLNSLGAAAFFLFCCNTNELFATGFQLSFAVVGAIVLLADPLSRWIRRWSAPDAFLPKTLLSLPRKLWHTSLARLGSASAVSAAAWIGSFGLIAAYFCLVTPISLIANLVVVPLAFFVIAIALLSVLTAPLATSVAVVFNNANLLLARIVLAIVHFFAHLPAGHYYVAHVFWPDGARARMDVLDVGAGGAIRASADGQNWLFDCGAVRDYDRTLRPYLQSAGVNRLDGLVLSHGDSQHIGGALLLLNDMAPRHFIDNVAPDHSRTHQQVRRLAQQIRLDCTPARAEGLIELGHTVSAKVLHPAPNLTAGVADDQALVVQVKLPSATVLLMSDNGEATEHALVASRRDLRADIIVKGQNHASPSASDSFLDAVKPRLIVATSRAFPSYERIRDDWAEGVRARGIRLFRQDETGAVQVRFWDHHWEAKAYVTGEIFRSDSR